MFVDAVEICYMVGHLLLVSNPVQLSESSVGVFTVNAALLSMINFCQRPCQVTDQKRSFADPESVLEGGREVLVI